MTASAPLLLRLYRSFGILLGLLLFLVGFSLYNFRKLGEANDLNSHSYRVLLANNGVEERVFSIDSDVRGYLVGGEKSALASYKKDVKAFPQSLEILRDLVSDNPTQSKKVNQIALQQKRWIDDIVEPLIRRRASIKDRNQAIMAAGLTSAVRRRAIAGIRKTLVEIETVERGLLASRTQAQLRQRWWTQFTLALGGLFSMVVTVGLVTVIGRSSQRLDQANAQLRLEKRRAEDANLLLSKSNASLESEIEQRRAAEDKLRDNLVELQRSNAELEQFAYVASHDLQEPLRAVGGCVQVLQKRYQGQLDARADQFIQHAVEGAQRMQNLINDLLSYSRLGTKNKEFEAVSGEKIIAGALKNISVSVRETEAQITHDALPILDCDAGQIEQVLQNLLSNAIKFRGDKPPLIHVGCRRQSGAGPEGGGGGDFWVLSVADEGLGIEPQYFERIFVMFQRLHTRADYAGTGIGLAICKKIVERHGGQIWVESAAGKGSKFSFSLPVGQK
jgi:signal transduction histidine kinase